MRVLLTYAQAKVKWVGTTPVLRTTSASDFVPETLFLSGETGIVYDPSDLRSMHTDVDGDTRVSADGNNVKRISDQMGRFTTEATNWPVWNTAAARRYLTFDGSNDTIAAGATSTILQNVAYATLIFAGENAESAAARYMLFLSTVTVGNTRARMNLTATDLLQIGARRLDADSLTTAAGSTTIGPGTRVYRGEWDFAGVNKAFGYINGTLEVTLDPLSASGAGNTSNTTGSRRLGSDNGSVSVWSGKCHFAMVIARSLTAAEKANLDAYAARLAGI
jgi:hypothetical protein